MMSAYICRQCRIRVIRCAASAPSSQWQPKATFVSLRPDPAHSASEQHVLREEEQHETPDRRDEEPDSSLIGFTTGPHPGRYSKYAQATNTAEIASVQDQGENIIRRVPVGSGLHSHRELSPSYALAIDMHLDRKHVNDAWGTFCKSYTSRECPAFKNPSFNDVPLLNGSRVFFRLLSEIVRNFCEGSDQPVTPTAALFRYEQLGISRPEMWQHAFTSLTNELLWSLSGSTRKTRGSTSILLELVALWRLLFQCKGKTEDTLESIKAGWNGFPDLSSLTGCHQTKNFGARLQQYHPKTPTSPALQFCAVALFNVFNDHTRTMLEIPETLREQSAPLLELVAYLMAGSSVSSALTHFVKSVDSKALPDDFRKAIISQIRQAPTQAMKMTGLQYAEGNVRSDAKELSDAEKALNLEQFYLKRIAREVTSQSHLGRLEHLWGEVSTVYGTMDHHSTIPPLVYDAFLSGFLALRQSDRAVRVWNHMIAHGVKPESRTWGAMIAGCVKAKDLASMDGIWERMLRSGARPDHHAWTARVHGLMTLGEINRAFTALDDMGKRWLAAVDARGKTDSRLVNNYAKPSIEVVNGAISGLVQIRGHKLRLHRRLEYVQRILRWAANFDIKPDAYTYNILIQMYLNVGDNATAFKLLQQMDREGIEADMATYTILVRAAFDNQAFNDLTEAEQTDRILRIFAELENGGLKLNSYIYSSTIDRLLKQYGNHSAARTVIDHMQSRNLMLSPHIYTSLVTHYFQQEPPDIEAVDSLMLSIFGPPRAPTDKILFDRVIEGYAKHGELGKMMSVLARMSAHGKLPGYKALTAVVGALAKAGDWERARLVVRDVQMGMGVAEGGVTGGVHGQREFFFMVQKLGLGLDEPFRGKALHSESAHTAVEGPATEAAGPGDAQVLDVTRKGDAQEKMDAQKREQDNEFVNAEHASYLSDA